MECGDLEKTTKGRHFLNTWLVPRVANMLPNGNRVLFVGTETSWDYKSFFWSPAKQCPYETVDKAERFNPDIVADIQDCPSIPDETYGLVILIGVYEYLDKVEEAFSEIKRILTKDGLVLIAFTGKGYYPDNRGVSPTDVYSILHDYRVLETYNIYQKNEEPNSVCVLCQKI